MVKEDLIKFISLLIKLANKQVIGNSTVCLAMGTGGLSEPGDGRSGKCVKYRERTCEDVKGNMPLYSQEWKQHKEM